MDAITGITDFLGGGIGTILAFLFVLTIVVFVHESGHFWMGRLFGTRIETFSIGFGRSIAGWTDRKGTVWKIGWLPLGGYVKFWGDENAASTPDGEQLAELRQDPEARACFHFKPLWQKALIVAAGPLANFIFAIVVYFFFFLAYGVTTVTPVVGNVLADSPAARAGLQTGDLILALDNQPIEDFTEIVMYVTGSDGQPIAVTYRRGSADAVTVITPERRELTDALGYKHNDYRLGFQLAPDAPQRHNPLGVIDSVGASVSQVGFVLTSTVTFITRLIVGKEDARKLSGPVGMADTAGKVAKQLGFLALIQLIALVSISIGFVNLLPIPMLDGGHLLFYGIEAVRRRPLGERSQEYGLRIGLALVLSLMLFATWNDLVRILWS